MVDELDYLITKDYKVLYNFFNWPLQHLSSLLFIGIANTTNLPEELTSRVKSRIDIYRTIFKPYSHEQIKEILEARLSDLQLDAFDSKVVEFVSRKVIIAINPLIITNA